MQKVDVAGGSAPRTPEEIVRQKIHAMPDGHGTARLTGRGYQSLVRIETLRHERRVVDFHSFRKSPGIQSWRDLITYNVTWGI